MPTNDNDSGMREPDVRADAYGQAALVLVESLIHGLCEKSVLTTDEAIDIIDRAVSVQSDRAQAFDGAAVSLWRSHALLSSIAASLKVDAADAP